MASGSGALLIGCLTREFLEAQFPASVRLYMPRVCRQWNTHVAPMTPAGRFLINQVQNENGRFQCVRAPSHRDFLRPPYASVPDDLDSSLVVDLEQLGHFEDDEVFEQLPELFQKAMDMCLYQQPLRILSLATSHISLLQLVGGVPHDLFKHLHTLRIQQCDADEMKNLDVLSHLTMETYPSVRTLVVNGSIVLAVDRLMHLFPNLHSLQTNSEVTLVNCSCLPLYSSLRCLSVVTRESDVPSELAVHIGRCQQLRQLMIRDEQLSAHMGQEIAMLANLSGLKLVCTTLLPSDKVVLERLAASIPGLQELGLVVNSQRFIVLPKFPCLQRLTIPHNYTPNNNIKQLELLHNTEGRIATLCGTPPELTEVRVKLDQLRSFVSCSKLQTLIVESPTYEYLHSTHAIMLRKMSQGLVWPLLTTLVFHAGSSTHISYDFFSSILRVLARKPRILSHVTFNNNSCEDILSMDLICSIASLTSVTIVSTSVSALQLRRLVCLPHMRVVELIDVVGVTDGQIMSIKLEHTFSRVRILIRTFAALKLKTWTPRDLDWVV